MTVHLFGATSSPGCGTYALKTTATEYKQEFGSEAANFVRDNFYVDDGLKSTPSSNETIELLHSTKELCKRGGFRVHKFVSNDIKVINAIPIVQRESGIKDPTSLSIARALRVQWCVESDTLRIRIELPSSWPTRHNVLSAVGSVFDPLGIMAPVVLKGKHSANTLSRWYRLGWRDPRCIKHSMAEMEERPQAANHR